MIEAIVGKPILSPKDICCDDTLVLSHSLSSGCEVKDIGQSGTAMRFMLAFLAVLEGRSFRLVGDRRMQSRPVVSLVDALRRLGADIIYEDKEGFLPLKINGRRLSGGVVEVDASQSSQFVSALMLIAPLFDEGLSIVIKHPTSFPYILLTKHIMQMMGIEVDMGDGRIYISPQQYIAREVVVESDFSSAVVWYAYCSLHSLPRMELSYFEPNSQQPDSVVVDIMKFFGITTEFENNSLILTQNGINKPSFFSYNFADSPDLVPVLVSMCCLLDVPFLFEGVKNLRIKESDRIEVMRKEMLKCGYLLQSSDDTISWDGSMSAINQKPIIDTHSDHRIAMAFALVSQKIDIQILCPDVVSKSYPTFWADFNILTE